MSVHVYARGVILAESLNLTAWDRLYIKLLRYTVRYATKTYNGALF